MSFDKFFFIMNYMRELEPKRVIGLMSGTSCDSIDVALCMVNPDLSCKLISGMNYKYPVHIREKLFKAFGNELSIKELCQLNFEVGECFANASSLIISEYGKPDMIASHGQTIYHYPFKDEENGISKTSTLQIGESAVIAQRTGCLTVSNFRETDIANGGQGAPLVCFADKQWFKNSAVQNIGGISNVTVLSDDCLPFGFDTGCGNLMIDYCMRKFFGKDYDKDGEIAASGKISEYWFNCLLEDEYYFNSPPKTTGREYFSTKYIENILKTAPESKEDIITTLTALTSKTIAQAYERFVYPNAHIEQVIIGGGGAYNKYMMKLLRKYLPKHIKLKTHEDFGISNNYKEAMAFALLGYCTYYGIPNNVPSCTGADKSVVLGKITHP